MPFSSNDILSFIVFILPNIRIAKFFNNKNRKVNQLKLLNKLFRMMKIG